MTREEAIKWIDREITWHSSFPESEELIKALNMAIDALEQEPSEDLISRQNVIDKLEKVGYDFSDSELSEIELEEVCEVVGDIKQDMINRIKRMPSAGRPKWIPVSERLPEVGQYVLASVHGDYAVHNIILTRYEGRQPFWSSGIITAWQPLPEPYEEGAEQ